MSAEEWRPVPGFPGYEVSDLGQVASTRVWRGKPGRRLLRPAPNGRSGHLKVWLSSTPRQVSRYVHHLVAEAFIGPRPDGLLVCHNDDNPSNNAVWNLRYGTYSDNEYDKVRNGRGRSAWAECQQGHPFTEANTYVRPSGTRLCRTCMRNNYRRDAAA